MTIRIRYCPECGEMLDSKATGDKGWGICKEHGEIYVDMDP